MMEGDIKLFYYNPGATLGGVIMLPDGTRLVIDHAGSIMLPKKHSHMVETLQGQHWYTAPDYFAIQQRNAAMREEREMYPYDVRQLMDYAREHGVGLQVRRGQLWANLPPACDPAFQRSLGRRYREVINELEQREKRWIQVN